MKMMIMLNAVTFHSKVTTVQMNCNTVLLTNTQSTFITTRQTLEHKAETSEVCLLPFAEWCQQQWLLFTFWKSLHMCVRLRHRHKPDKHRIDDGH